MKLLCLTGEFPPFRGGIATYAREMAEAAVDLGYEVTVTAPDYGGDQSAEDSRYPFRVLRFPGGESTARGIIDKLFWTRQLARRESFDIVHAIDWPFFLPVALSAYRRHARCLITFHGTEINQMDRASRRVALRLANFWNGWALSVANSRYTAQHLQRVFPSQRSDRLCAIPLGVRPPANLTTIGRDKARAGFGLGINDFMMMSLGRIVPRKGHHVTVAALARLPEAMRQKIVWYVVGPEIDPIYAARVKDEAENSGIRAVFAGAVPGDALERIFAASDLFCVPSTWGAHGEFEGFGLVYIEAGLRGIPSVATTVGGIPDAIIDGETGLLVEPDNPQALAEALTKVWADTGLRQKLADAARAHACAQSWIQVARRTYAT